MVVKVSQAGLVGFLEVTLADLLCGNRQKRSAQNLKIYMFLIICFNFCLSW